jgi:Tektin family
MLPKCILCVLQCRQHDNNTRLDDRVTKIRQLKDLLERTVENLDAEIKNLNEAKDLVEQILDHRVGLANHINVENLVSRESRRTDDVVEDMVEVQLFKVFTLPCMQFQV